MPQFPLYRDLGVGVYELPINWSSVAPTRPAQPTNPGDPAYQWSPAVDQAVAEAVNNGIQVSIMLVGAPRWANGNKPSQWAPRHPTDFADFAAAAARHYPAVHLWMIWGEPNRAPNWQPLTAAPPSGPLNHKQARAPHLYGRVLDASYGALKSVDSHNRVIGGMTFTAAGPGSIHTYQWIQYMRLPNGHMPRMDMYGQNPFGFRKPDLHDKPSPRGRVDFSDLGRLAHFLDRTYPGRHLKLFLSEWGVPTDSPDGELGFFVSRAEQASWINAAFRIARSWGRIYTLGWVHVYDDPTTQSTQGLLDAGGQPKPGYFAFRDG